MEKRLFGRNPFYTLKHRFTDIIHTLNRKLHPLTPPGSSWPLGHFRSWKVTGSFSAIALDRDKRWKHLRCVQDDDTDRLICHTTFPIRLWPWPWPWPRPNFQHDRLRSNHSLFVAPWRKKHDAGKMIVVSLLSQELLMKKFFFVKTTIFRFFDL